MLDKVILQIIAFNFMHVHTHMYTYMRMHAQCLSFASFYFIIIKICNDWCLKNIRKFLFFPLTIALLNLMSSWNLKIGVKIWTPFHCALALSKTLTSGVWSLTMGSNPYIVSILLRKRKKSLVSKIRLSLIHQWFVFPFLKALTSNVSSYFQVYENIVLYINYLWNKPTTRLYAVSH